MAHEGSVMAAFKEGETRFLFARYRSGQPGLYELVNGTAAEVRKFAKTELLCPIPECTTPEITTVNRKKYRQGFRHVERSTAHEDESLFHVEGKAQIAKWVRANYPDATAVEEQASSLNRERIADVMVTFADDRRIAIEIQYAALPPDDWQRRHDSYASMGIRDVWLFGHQGDQMRGRPGEDRVKLNPTHEAVAASGMPILWFNPEKLQVASATATRDDSFERLPALSGVGDLIVESLDLFSLTFESGLNNQRLLDLARAAVRYEAEKIANEIAHAKWMADEAARREKKRVADEANRARQQEAELLQKIRDAEKRAAGAPARAIEAEKQRARKALHDMYADSRERLATEWPTTPDGKSVLEMFGGEIPRFLGAYTQVVDMPIASIVWQSYLFLTVIEPLPPGARLRHLDLGTAIIARYELDISPIEAARLAIGWCEHLRIGGILEAGSSGWGAQYDVDKYRKAAARVQFRSPGTDPRPAAPVGSHEPVTQVHLEQREVPAAPVTNLSAHQRLPEPRIQVDFPSFGHREQSEFNRFTRYNPRAREVHTPITPPRATPKLLPIKCLTCGGPIDPLLPVASKYHTMCDTGFAVQD